jgi:hypothetical protein
MRVNPGWEDRREPGSLYHRRDIAVMAFCAGLLFGVITAFASCSPPDQPPRTCLEVAQ